jgi:polysaccharide biosynthesis/export protein
VSFCFVAKRSYPAWRVCFAWVALLLLPVLALCPALTAQPQQQTRQRQYGQINQDFDLARLSNLARQNLDYVAAPVQQIEAVLNSHPGLLVELQDWVARDATDHGQMVEQQQMSRDGIFDRLASDRTFRAVATRLLQRYGYLMPEVNPNSQLGKQQQLEYLAEQQRLQQRPARGSWPSYEQGGGRAYPASGRGSTAGPGMRRFKRNQQRLLQPEWGPAPGTPQSQPDLNNTNSELLASQEANSNAGPQSSHNLQGAGSVSLQTGSPGWANVDTNGEVGGGSGYGQDIDGLAQSATSSTLQPAAGSGPAGIDQPLLEQGAESPALPQGTLPRPWQDLPYYRQTGVTYQEASPRPPVVHRASPYSDIPSLYDLYKQVSPQSPRLSRFGLSVFENAPVDTTELPMDLPAGPNYVVGPGDGLTINLWGSVASRLYRVVDREGRLSLPEVGPLMVSGETMGAVQQRVQQALRTQFRNVSADVSLARLRSVRVYVVGEVRYPGAYDISSLSTPLNALFAAGGPTQDGSLRRVRHYRGKELVQNVDLYDLLLHGVRTDLKRLENGDTILVPPTGPEVKVEGMVRRPAIYELHGEDTLAQVLQLAGGILPTAALRHIEVQRVEAHEKRTMLSLNIRNPKGSAAINQHLESFPVHDGDVIRIFPIAPYNRDAVYLEGHVLRPGRYSYQPGMRLSDLISSYSDLLPEPAMHYAEIIRLMAPNDAPKVVSFDLAKALSSPKTSPKLDPLDTVRIFSRFDFHYAPTVTVGGDVRSPGTYRTSGVVHVRDVIYQAGGVAPDAYLGSAQLVRSLPDGKLKIMSINLREALDGNPLENVLLEPRDTILVHRNPLNADPPSVFIRGEVIRPGRFPLTANLRISDLVGLAGGLKRSADRQTADLTCYNVGDVAAQGRHQQINLKAALRGSPAQDPFLKDGDVLTIKEVPGWNDMGASVTIRGEVAHPGTYGFFPGERLSSVLKRAGGFLPAAYPQAAVFDRIEVRRLQEKSRDQLIQEVQQNATKVRVSINESAAGQAELQNAALQQRTQVLEALRSAPVTGRLVIHLSHNLRAFANSVDDIQVRAGDTLFVPKRPDFVVVTGQVYNSNAIAFEAGRSAAWYLSRAGGVSGLGNKKAIFIVRSNGSVVSGGRGQWWRGNVLSTRMGPGDTIVVPEKSIGGSTLWKNLIQISQVASSAAIAAAVATH